MPAESAPDRRLICVQAGTAGAALITGEDGGQAIDLRWRSARERLAGAGADEATRAALYFLPGDLVTSIQAPPGGVGATLRYTREAIV